MPGRGTERQKKRLARRGGGGEHGSRRVRARERVAQRFTKRRLSRARNTDEPLRRDAQQGNPKTQNETSVTCVVHTMFTDTEANSTPKRCARKTSHHGKRLPHKTNAQEKEKKTLGERRGPSGFFLGSCSFLSTMSFCIYPRTCEVVEGLLLRQGGRDPCQNLFDRPQRKRF